MFIRAISHSLVLSLGVAVYGGFAGPLITSADTKLNASIKAESVQNRAERYEMISFHLENTSTGAVECRPETWSLIVDGKELVDSGMIFGNGPGPVGGYGTLRPGASFGFSKALDLVRYFPENKEHTVQWKGAGFTSNIVRFRNSRTANRISPN
jgi:hypothetical protein